MQPDFLVDFPGLGIQDLPISRVAFNLFNWPVYWYGLLIAVAIILCMLLAMKQAPAYHLTADDIMDTFIALIPAMIIMARVYYVVFEWNYYAQDWRRIFSTRDGGLAFYGGVIGGILAILLLARIKKVKVSRLLDFLAVYVPLGQAIGRWGNFFNQEAFGDNTKLPWGMYSNQTDAYLRSVTGIAGLNPGLPVHPTFFYEFIANLLIFAWLLRVRKRSKYPFATTLWYLLLYGVVRYFVEGIRTDPLMIPGTSIRISMLLSALMVVGSILLMIILNRRQQRLELAAALAGEPAEGPASSDVAGAGAETDADAEFIAVDDEGDWVADEKAAAAPAEQAATPAEQAATSAEPAAEPAEPAAEPAEPADAAAEPAAAAKSDETGKSAD